MLDEWIVQEHGVITPQDGKKCERGPELGPLEEGYSKRGEPLRKEVRSVKQQVFDTALWGAKDASLTHSHFTATERPGQFIIFLNLVSGSC
jgi:hypothetical protein